MDRAGVDGAGRAGRHQERRCRGGAGDGRAGRGGGQPVVVLARGRARGRPRRLPDHDRRRLRPARHARFLLAAPARDRYLGQLDPGLCAHPPADVRADRRHAGPRAPRVRAQGRQHARVRVRAGAGARDPGHHPQRPAQRAGDVQVASGERRASAAAGDPLRHCLRQPAGWPLPRTPTGPWPRRAGSTARFRPPSWAVRCWMSWRSSWRGPRAVRRKRWRRPRPRCARSRSPMPWR